jgi:3-hydroxyisobutyrate dehydrogenase-like beta-hydroxyacid dehydrogenase
MEATGMVGVGRMGTAILERLLLAGAHVTVCDLDAAAVERARALGASVGATPADVSRAATMIHVIVHADEDVFACTTGPGGILEGAKPGTVVLIHSTIEPETTKAVAEAGARKDVTVVDACMLGMPNVVRAGGERFLIGCPDELVERVRSHILQVGKQVVHAGPVGSANVIKLVNNLLYGCQPLIIHEAIQIARAGGVSYAHALDTLQQLHTGAVIERWEGSFDPAEREPLQHLGNNVFGKDLPLLAELAESYGVNAPITRVVAAEGKRLLDEGRGDDR